MVRKAAAIAVVLFAACRAPAAPPAGGTVLTDMDTLRHKPTEGKAKDGTSAPVGTAELVEGRFGKACRFAFDASKGPAFMTGWVVFPPEADAAAGISFHVKGDGSRSWGGLELIDGNDYKLRYGVCFPVDSTEWRKVVVPWRDVIPELAGPRVDPNGGYRPSRFRNLWFGKWFYWREQPGYTVTVDRVALEPTIDLDRADYTPKAPGLPRTLAKLKARQAVTIVTMGDSLSDKRHWANKQQLWSERLVEKLRGRFGGPVRLVNPALGGTTLSQNLILMPRWLKDTPRPDLVTVCFGYNDYSSGVRGERFAEYLRLAVDRIRRETHGAAEVLLMTTCPAHNRWQTMDEMAQAVRTVAGRKNTGLADLAAAFHQAGSADEALKRNYWAWDKTHLGAKGHELVADTVLDAIAK